MMRNKIATVNNFVTINSLNKSFGKLKAVDNLSLSVPKGEIYGLVGPNGAGKTTIIKIICGLLCADNGEIAVGQKKHKENLQQIKEITGYMPDSFGVYDNLKVFEYMDFYASIYIYDSEKRRKICNELLQKVNLLNKAEEYVENLSRGNKQRLCFARCLVNEPELLLLDEPAAGMDPRAWLNLKNVLKEYKAKGTTIIISSNVLSEISEICTSMGVIDNGKIILSDKVEKIIKDNNNESLEEIYLKLTERDELNEG